MTVHRFCFGVTTLVTLLAYRNSFTDDGLLRAGLPGLTQVVVASGAGTVLGAVLTPRLARVVSKQRQIAALLVVGAAVEIGLGLPYEKAGFVAAGLVLGVVSQGSKICVDTLVQENVDDAFRGRVFSVYDTLFNVAFVAAAALAAVVLPADGHAPAALVVLGAVYAIAAVAYALADRTGRRAVRDGRPVSRPPG
jgi:predicted MFS family arabinose efflux permease